MRRQVRDELRSLGLRSPLDTDELSRRLGERRGRPVVVTPAPLPVPGPFGIWLATADRDVIIHQSRTSLAHQRLIVLHEIGHIMAGHGGGTEPSAYPWPTLDDTAIARLFPALPPDMVRRALSRENYDDDDEHQAELLGSIVFEWDARLTESGYRSASTAVGRNIQDALEEHSGWV